MGANTPTQMHIDLIQFHEKKDQKIHIVEIIRIEINNKQ